MAVISLYRYQSSKYFDMNTHTLHDTVTVIIPAYNEEENIAAAVKTAIDVVSKLFSDFKIFIVNDGSTDTTGKIADQLASKNNNITVVHHQRNEGIGAAFRDGIAMASHYYLTGFPGDNDFSKEAFGNLLMARKKNCFVSSYMTDTSDREAIRQIISIFFSKMMNLIFHLRLKYYNGYFICPLKFVQPIRIKSPGFTFFAEIKIKVIKKNVKYIEIPFTYIPRLRGVSKALTWKSVFQTLYFIPVIIRDVHFTSYK